MTHPPHLTPLQSPAHLVELMEPSTLQILDVDLCARLDVAMQLVYKHLKSTNTRCSVEFSYDEQGQLEGVGFFNDTMELVSCITVYRLARDNDVPDMKALAEALAQDEPHRSEAVNFIFQF